MIEIYDLSVLEAVREAMTGLVLSQQENWDDDVYHRIVDANITPAIQDASAVISQVTPYIHHIVQVYRDIENAAMGY